MALTSRLDSWTAELARPRAAFQTSTLQALADGNWNGQAWRARSDGSIVRVADAERAPFAVVTAFVADATLTVRRQVEHWELLWTIKTVAHEMGASLAIRFDGALDAVRARSVTPQYLPDRARSVLAATQQGHFTLGPVAGTLVGFSFARWADDFEPPGIHRSRHRRR
jgi:acetolactate decarboxylase